MERALSRIDLKSKKFNKEYGTTRIKFYLSQSRVDLPLVIIHFDGVIGSYTNKKYDFENTNKKVLYLRHDVYNALK